jgi:hypothetical protein
MMTIEKCGGFARSVQPFSIDIGMTAGESENLDPLKPRLFHLPGRPPGRVAQRLGRESFKADAGDFGIVDQLSRETAEVIVQIVKGLFGRHKFLSLD